MYIVYKVYFHPKSKVGFSAMQSQFYPFAWPRSPSAPLLTEIRYSPPSCNDRRSLANSNPSCRTRSLRHLIGQNIVQHRGKTGFTCRVKRKHSRIFHFDIVYVRHEREMSLENRKKGKVNSETRIMSYAGRDRERHFSDITG